MGETTTSEPYSGSKVSTAETPTIIHEETSQDDATKWNMEKPTDGDTAMALFSDPTDLHEDVDPAVLRKLLWKIDFMVLPYLSVCYAFFYIDKVFDSSSFNGVWSGHVLTTIGRRL